MKINRESENKKINHAYTESRKAFKDWQTTTIKERVKYLKELKVLIADNTDEIVKIINGDIGKVPVDIIMNEILASLEIIDYYIKNAAKIIGREKRSSPFPVFIRNKSYVEYGPLGVVLIISPWNFPFQLALVPAVTALTAGNTVILKPSELAGSTGRLISDLMTQVFPESVFQIVEGGATTGQRLIAAKPDKIFFTGSIETGKKIREQTASQLIPIELEMGGKDPMIVFSDADLERAARAAVYGAFINAGQICVAIEQLYVQETVYDDFLKLVKEKTAEIKIGTDVNSEVGAIISDKNREKILSQIEEAVKEGAETKTELKYNDKFIEPLIITGTDNKMDIIREETFGPVLPVIAFRDIEKVLASLNKSKYGLNASIWSEDVNKALSIAKKLKTGNCYINDVIKNIGNPDLPFGGAKMSGIGCYHGPEGLKSFSQQKSIMVSKNKFPEMNWFPYNKKLYKIILDIIDLRYNELSFVNKIKKIVVLALKILKRLRK